MTNAESMAATLERKANVCADVTESYPAASDLQVVLFGAEKLCGKP